MEVYATDEERVEALKKWWKDNSTSVVMGVALGLAVMGGWKAWTQNREQKAEAASVDFQQLIKAVENNQTEPALKLAQRIVEQHQGTPYPVYAALFEAKLKVEADDLAGAKKVLSDLLASTKDENLRHIVRLRLGQVQLAMGEAEPALNMLTPLKPRDMGDFEAAYEQLKGDLYLALNRPDDARLAYQTAKQKGDTDPLLILKLDQLAVEAPKNPS